MAALDVHRVYRALGLGFRRRRVRRFEAAFRPTEQTRVLDVGGTPGHWELTASRPRVTLLNVAPPAGARALPERFRVVTGSGTHLPHPDGAFDVGFSNSVIEHLGSLERQRAFAAELRRVARGLWVQTPARAFPFEPHLLTPFVHYLPVRWRRALLRNFTVWGWITRPGPAVVDRFLRETRLLSRAELAALFPDCEIRCERVLGLPKSYVAVRRAGP